MNLYFDTSAIIPLLIQEPNTEAATFLWDTAVMLVSTRLLYPEARAAIARARRMERLKGQQYHTAIDKLDYICAQFDYIELNERLSSRAGYLADMLNLRGYDAVHLAAAESGANQEEELQMVTGDIALQSASARLGLKVAELG